MVSHYDREGRELAAGRRFRRAVVGSIIFHVIVAVTLVAVMSHKQTIIPIGGISISLGGKSGASGGGGGGAAPPRVEPPKPKTEEKPKKEEPKPPVKEEKKEEKKEPEKKPEKKEPEKKPEKETKKEPEKKPEKEKEKKKEPEKKPEEKKPKADAKKEQKPAEKKTESKGNPEMDNLALDSLDRPPSKNPKLTAPNATGTGDGGMDIGGPKGAGVNVAGGMPSILSGWAVLVQRKIEMNWIPPSGVQMTEENKTVEILFTIDRLGNLIKPPKLAKEGGSVELSDSGMQAILAAAPLPPLPDDYDAVEQEVLYVFTLSE